MSPHDTTTTGDPLAAHLTEPIGPQSLSVEEALSQLPAIDKSCLYNATDTDTDLIHPCTCRVAEPYPAPTGSPIMGSPSRIITTNIKAIIEKEEDDEVDNPEKIALQEGAPFSATFSEAIEDPECKAKQYLANKYKLRGDSANANSILNLKCVVTTDAGDANYDASVTELLTRRLPSVNGNFSSEPATTVITETATTDAQPHVKVETESSSDCLLIRDRGLYANVVPKNEEIRLETAALPSENYKKYSISNSDGAVGDVGVGVDKAGLDRVGLGVDKVGVNRVGGDGVVETWDVSDATSLGPTNYKKYSISNSDGGMGVDEVEGDKVIDLNDEVQRVNIGDASSLVGAIQERTAGAGCENETLVGATRDLAPPSDGGADCDDTALTDFREWHETLDVKSYGGETFRILPYVIID